MTTIEDGFKQVLDDFKKRLKPGEAEKFASIQSLKDVELTAKDIQEKQRRSKTAQNLNRIQPFLQAMGQYKDIIEVFLNASSMLCFVWGPMKFMLMIASNWSKSFDILLDTYKQISENFPLLLKYRSMFEKNDHMKKVLVWIYEDILKFHLRAWRVFSQPAWIQLFHATWKDFQESFKPIMNDLTRHRELIESTANLVHFQESRDARLQSQAAFAALEEEQNRAKTLAVVNWLSAADASLDQEAFAATRHDLPDTGRWILNESKVMEWLEPNDLTVPLFWLNGIPGAGKTILASVIIEEVSKLKGLKAPVSVAYFYCRDQDVSRNKFVGLANAILNQLLAQNASLLPYLYDECKKSHKVILASAKECGKILGTVLKAIPKTFIVIDGIDECDSKERKLILDLFSSVVSEEEKNSRVLFVSQELNDIKTALHEAETLRLNEEHIKHDVRNYSIKMSLKIQQRFPRMPDEAREHILKLVCDGAEGMFLFAKLVLENLHHQANLEDVYKELKPDTFPKGFEQAYARIVQRIYKNPNDSQRRAAEKVVGWITCSKRPLKWQEIQGATAIDLVQRTVNFHGRESPDHVRDICGSLVEVLPGDRIQLVHATARRYLLEYKCVNVPKEQADLAVLCMQYLTFDCFDPGLTYEAMLDYIKEGHYAFLDYAVLHWNHHLESAVLSQKSEDSLHSADLSIAINEFFETYQPGPMGQEDAQRKFIHRFASIEAMEMYESVVLLLSHAHSSRLSEDQIDALGPLGQSLTKVRAVLEELSVSKTMDNQMKENLQKFYGKNWHKCSRHACYYFHEGFPTERGLTQHTNRHEKPFCCTEMGCTRMYIGWSTEKELKKHTSQFHPDPEAFSWKFPHVKKPPAVSKCELCGKEFTRANTLKTHKLREHAKVRDFVCKTCGKAFVRKYECDRHESIHLNSKEGSSQPAGSGEKNDAAGSPVQ